MKKIFLFIACSYFLFFFLIPPFQIPDEPEHFENIYWLSQGTYPYRPTTDNVHQNKLYADKLIQLYETNQVIKDFILPNFSKIKKSNLRNINDLTKVEKSQLTKRSAQTYHPPVYYLLGAILFNVSKILKLNLISQFYFVRLASTLFYFGTVFLAYKILQFIFKDQKIITNLLIFFSLNPLLLSIGSGMNADNGVTFFSLLFLYSLLRISKNKNLSIKQIVLMGCLSGLSTLSKISGAFTILVGVMYLIKKSGFSKIFIRNCIILLLSWGIFILPWLLFNYQRYGVPLVENFTLVVVKPLMPNGIIQSIVKSLLEFRHTFMHYAGFIGWNETHPFKWFYILYFFIFSSLFIIGTFSSLRLKKTNNFPILSYVFSLVFVLFLLGFDFKHKGVPWDLQGRYFLPAFLPTCVIILSGLSIIIKKPLDKISYYLSIFAVIHYYIILFLVLIPKYYV